MNNDEAKLIQQLKSLDVALPFDADALARRVVATRSRRRKRRVLAGCCGAAMLMLAGLGWQLLSESERPIVVEDETPATVTPTTDLVADQKQTDDAFEAIWADFKQRQQHQQRLNSLLDRIEAAKSGIAALRQEQMDQRLTIYRAELSRDLTIPDLSGHYVGTVGDPRN